MKNLQYQLWNRFEWNGKFLFQEIKDVVEKEKTTVETAEDVKNMVNNVKSKLEAIKKEDPKKHEALMKGFENEEGFDDVKELELHILGILLESTDKNTAEYKAIAAVYAPLLQDIGESAVTEQKKKAYIRGAKKLTAANLAGEDYVKDVQEDLKDLPKEYQEVFKEELDIAEGMGAKAEDITIQDEADKAHNKDRKE